MIYGYKHWTLEEVPRCFYVGKGLLGRAESQRGRNHKWHAIAKKLGLRVEICASFLTNEEACDWEIKTIEQMKTFTFCHHHNDANDIVCNFTLGGEGVLGRFVSEETRKKISCSQRGEKSAWFGQQHTKETRRKISEKKQGSNIDVSTRIKIATTNVGRKVPDRGEVWRSKIAASNVRRKGIKLSLAKRIRKFNEVENQLVLLCGGPDRCGKTNILRELEKHINVPYFKASGEHENFLLSQDKFINELRYADPRMHDLLYQTGMSVLIDRGYMCEWVYAQYFKRETDMSMLRVMDNKYSTLGAKILICTRKSFAGIRDDLDSSIDETALQQLSDLYLKFIEWTKCETHVLYVDDENLNREISDIVEWLSKTS